MTGACSRRSGTIYPARVILVREFLSERRSGLLSPSQCGRDSAPGQGAGAWEYALADQAAVPLGNELTLIHPGWVRRAHTVSPTELPAILAADFSIELTAQTPKRSGTCEPISPAGTPVKANDRPEKQRQVDETSCASACQRHDTHQARFRISRRPVSN